MRSLKESILSTTKVGRFDEWNVFKAEHAHPKDRDELKSTIEKAIELKGNKVDLNWIDIGKITDMTDLFRSTDFNGDISNWDVSNVEDMYGMFASSEFNGDISNWDVSNVKYMAYMFFDSKFDGDISKWNIRKLKTRDGMFKKCPLEKNPPKWYK